MDWLTFLWLSWVTLIILGLVAATRRQMQEQELNTEMDMVQAHIFRAKGYMEKARLLSSNGWWETRQAMWSLILALEELSSKADSKDKEP